MTAGPATASDECPRGPRILVTRAAHQASALADELRALHAWPVVIPSIEIAAPSDGYTSLDHAVETLDSFNLVIVTSANGVAALAGRCTRPWPQPLRVAAIGNATAAAFSRTFGLAQSSIITPETAVAEGLADTVLGLGMALSSRVLLVVAEAARDVLPTALAARGYSVTTAHAYRNQLPGTSPALLREAAAALPPLAAITFTSASSVRNTVALFAAAGIDVPASAIIASIGPITSAALREHGLAPQVESSEANIRVLAVETMRALAEADAVS